MTAFRANLAASDARPITDDVVRNAVADAMASSNFVGRLRHQLEFTNERCEEVFWELFHGHALDESKTRERRRFVAWSIGAKGECEPLVAVRWDHESQTVHVTRSILCRMPEAFDAGGGVIDSRMTIRRQRELVGSIDLAAIQSAGHLRDRLAELLFYAVVGLSRLPLTSVDSPLPQFSLGELSYCYRAADSDLAPIERVKRLEFALRAAGRGGFSAAMKPGDDDPDESDPCDSELHQPWEDVSERFLPMFDMAALSPWTDFVAHAIAWLRFRDGPGGTRRFSLLARLMVRIARHLNAYDLVTFHHFGANYPDALLVEQCLRELLTAPVPARDEDWRKGVRAAAIVACEYAGHLVPDSPTSMGDASRVLPESFPPIPEVQIATPHARTRRLFEDGSLLSSSLVRDCLAETGRADALIELGTALFIDRPLGVGKMPGEPDYTWLGSHLLFSRTLAEKRLRKLARHGHLVPDADAANRWRRCLDAVSVDGVPLSRRDAPSRPGVASLQDAFMIADDFVVMRSTQRAIRDFRHQYDCSQLVRSLPFAEWQAIMATVTDECVRLTVYDRDFRPRIDLEADLSRGFVRAGGTEYVAAGFRVIGNEAVVVQAQSS
ncbi:MAG: hypothetical protein U0746_00300 [Gemmataceae bacterium]